MVARVRAPLSGLLVVHSVFGVLAACAADPGVTTVTTTAPVVTTGDAPTGSTGDECLGSGECDSEGICVADYQQVDTTPPGGTRGAAACEPDSACIGSLDLTRWCFDHQGCCDDLRCHPADGVCEPAGLGLTTGEHSTSSSTSSADATTSASDSTATDGENTSGGDPSSTG
jgi:hypothetical protein